MHRLGAAITALTLSGCTLLLAAALLCRRATARPPARPFRGAGKKKKVRFLEQPLTTTRTAAAASGEAPGRQSSRSAGDERCRGSAAAAVPAPNRSALYSGMLRYRAQMATSMTYAP